MLLACPACGNASEVAEATLPPPGSRGRCGGCLRLYVFDGSALVDDDATPPQGTRPLDVDEGDDPDATPINPVDAIRHSAIEDQPRWIPQAPEPEPEPPPDAWWVRAAGREMGPLDLADVKGMIRVGDLVPGDEVRPPGGDWGPAETVAGLQRWFTIRSKVQPARSDDDPFARCRRHPGASGEWLCGQCGSVFCSQCVTTANLGRLQGLKVCPTCQKACQPIAKRRVVVPFWREWGEVFAMPVRGHAWIAILLLGFAGMVAGVAGAAPIYGPPAAGILKASIFAYLLFVLRTAAQGKKGLPNLGHVANFVDDMVIPGLKGILVSAIAVLPLILYGLFVVPQVGLLKPSEKPFLGMDLDDPELQLTDAEKEQLQEAQAAFDVMVEEYEAQTGEEFPVDMSDPFGAGSEETTGQDEAANPWEEAARNMPQAGKAGLQDEEATPEDESEDGDDEKPTPGWRLPWYLTHVKLMHVLAYTLLGLWALLVWPLLLIIVALFNTVRPAFSPQLLVRIIQEIRPEYLALVGTVGGLLIVQELASGLLRGVPAFGLLLASFVAFYFNLVIFHVTGRLAYQVEEKLDWY